MKKYKTVQVPLRGLSVHGGGSKQIKIAPRYNKDAFGGRVNSQSHRINLAIIRGVHGTPNEIAEVIKEPVENVSAQLSFLHSKGLVGRKRNGRAYIYVISRLVKPELAHN